MGQDYYAFKLKPDSSLEEIRALANEQALHFQANPYFWASSPYTGLDYVHEILNQKHRQAYIDASRRLRDRIDFIKIKANDLIKIEGANEEVVDSYRIFGFDLDIFPWMWRLDSHRTVLPDDLPAFLEKRKTWWDEVKAGKHRAFLARYYCHAAYRSIRENYELLRNYVLDWISEDRTKRRLSQEFFDEVLHYVPPFSEPVIVLDPDVPPSWHYVSDRDPLELAEWYSKEVQEVGGMLREWNRNSSGRWKLQNHLHLHKDLESFLAQFEDAWFNGLYTWAKGIADQGGGLYLDT